MSRRARQRKATGHKDKRRGFRNVPMDRLREQTVANRREGGVHNPTVLADQTGIRAAIAAQMCPFCERGPFKMLPVHTNKIHGIDKWELRELAGYTTRDPISSEEARGAMSAAWTPTGLEKAREAQPPGAARGKYRTTRAGRQHHREVLQERELADPEGTREQRLVALAVANSPESTEKRSETMRRNWQEADPETRQRQLDHLGGIRAKGVAAAAVVNRRPIPEHGNLNRYKHHGCRCDLCRAAKVEDRRKAAR